VPDVRSRADRHAAIYKTNPPDRDSRHRLHGGHLLFKSFDRSRSHWSVCRRSRSMSVLADPSLAVSTGASVASLSGCRFETRNEPRWSSNRAGVLKLKLQSSSAWGMCSAFWDWIGWRKKYEGPCPKRLAVALLQSQAPVARRTRDVRQPWMVLDNVGPETEPT